jgi:galactose mutarotase-like enzyme
VHADEKRLMLTYRFRPDDDGFPGTVGLTLTYTVDADIALAVD